MRIRAVPLETAEWTSITEDLPEPHTDCLIINEHGRIAVRKFCKHKFSKGAAEVLYWIALPQVCTYKR